MHVQDYIDVLSLWLLPIAGHETYAILLDRLIGFNLSEPDDSPYAFRIYMDILDRIEEIGEDKAFEIIGR